MLDFDSLDWQTFEALAIMLLRRESYKVTSSIAPGRQGSDGGVDAIAIAPNEKQTFVIVQHLRQKSKVSAHQARHTIDVATRLRDQFLESDILFIVSTDSRRRLAPAWVKTKYTHGIVPGSNTCCRCTPISQMRSRRKPMPGIYVICFRNPSRRYTPLSKVGSQESSLKFPRGPTGWKAYEETAAKLLFCIRIMSSRQENYRRPYRPVDLGYGS